MTRTKTALGSRSESLPSSLPKNDISITPGVQLKNGWHTRGNPFLLDSVKNTNSHQRLLQLSVPLVVAIIIREVSIV